MNPTASIKLREGLKNPFVGLRAFDTNESLLFFGREQQQSEILERLRYSRFLSVIGNSGCGKSSLVRAGLIPRLKGGFIAQQFDRWQTAVMRPSNDPLYFLAEAIIKSEPEVKLYRQDEVDIKATALKEEIIQKGATAVCTMIDEINKTNGEPANFLLLVDQFEELFNDEIKYKSTNKIQNDVGRIHDHQIRFVNTILTLTQQVQFPVFVILTMRSDFLGHCNQFFGLPEAMNQGQYLVPRLDREQRRAAIEGPIKLFDAKINTLLLNRLLIESDSSQDELPLLQHAMMRTWQSWENENRQEDEIGIKHYRNAGGMDNALSNHANYVYDHLLRSGIDNDSHLFKNQKIAEIIFKSLIKIDERGRRIRRPQELEKLVRLCTSMVPDVTASNIEFVINQFRVNDNAFLSPYKGPLYPGTEIDISHESLIRKWDKLNDEGKTVGWITKEYNAGRIYLWLSECVTEKRQPLQSLDIKRVDEWRQTQKPNIIWAQRYSENYDEVVTYINNSKANLSKKKLKSYSLFGSFLILLVVGVFYFSRLNAKAETALATQKNLELEGEIAKAQALELVKEKANNLKAFELEKEKARVEKELADKKATILELEKSKIQEESYYYQIQLEPLFASEIFKDTSLKRLAINELLELKKRKDIKNHNYNLAIKSMNKAIDAKVTALADPNFGFAKIYEANNSNENIITKAIGDTILKNNLFYKQKVPLSNVVLQNYTNLPLLSYSSDKKIYIYAGTRFIRTMFSQQELKIENDSDNSTRFYSSYIDSVSKNVPSSFSYYGPDSIIYLLNRDIYKLHADSTIGKRIYWRSISKLYSNAAFSPNSNLLLTTNSADSGFLWSIRNAGNYPIDSVSFITGEKMKTGNIPPSKNLTISCVKFSGNNNSCIIGYSNGDIKMWKFGKGIFEINSSKAKPKNDNTNSRNSISAIDISENGNFIACFENGTLAMFDKDGKAVSNLSILNKPQITLDNNSKTKVAISPNGRFVIIYNNLEAKLIDLSKETSKKISVFQSKTDVQLNETDNAINSISILGALFLDNNTLYTYSSHSGDIFRYSAMVQLWMVNPDFSSLSEAIKSANPPYLDIGTKIKYGLINFQIIVQSNDADLLKEALFYYGNKMGDSDAPLLDRNEYLSKIKSISNKLKLVTNKNNHDYLASLVLINIFENLLDKLNGRFDYKTGVNRIEKILSIGLDTISIGGKKVDENTLSMLYAELSWNQILSKDLAGAKKSSLKSIDLESSNSIAIKNLALSYLVNNDYSEAKSIILKYMDEDFDGIDLYDDGGFFNYYGKLIDDFDVKYKQLWLKDFEILEKERIITFKNVGVSQILDILKK